VALAIMVANAAFAQSVNTIYDKRANFAAYRTFMWIKEPATTDAWMRERLVRDVNSALTARGLQLVTSGADLGLAAHGVTEHETTLAALYAGFDGGWQWDGRLGSAAPARGTYASGTLLVDIFDADTKEAIWRATSSKALAEYPPKSVDTPNKTVLKMFRSFPPPTEENGGLLGWMVEVLTRGLVASVR
jgi:hypothetical protein